MIESRMRRLLILAGAATLGLAACGGSDDDSLDDRADVADPKVRFVHAAVAGPNVTLRRNGNAEPDATNVPYKGASRYYDVGSQTYTFSLRTTTGDVELDSLTLPTGRGNRYTLLALAAASGVQLLSIRDPYNKSVASDDARLRVVNAAPNTGAFDVYVTSANTDLTGAAPQFAGVGQGAAMPGDGSDSVDFEGGTYRLRITPAGGKAPFFDATISLPANADWLLVALPESASPNSVRLLLVRADDSPDPTDEIVGS